MRTTTILILTLLFAACNSVKVYKSSTDKKALKTIHIVNLGNTLTSEKELNHEWVKLDEENFKNILSLLNNSNTLKDKDQFLKSIIKLDIRDTKDLGFGLTYYKCAQYGGYVTTWINLLSFKNEIIQYNIKYLEDDFKIIEYLINRDTKLKSEITIVADSINPYSFIYQNQSTFDKFKTNVADKLGPIKLLSDNSDKNFSLNYSILTNPINSYDFGAYCYEGSEEPEGRKAINYFTSSNNVSAIREIIKGYNPEGRLYAIEALLTAANEKKIILTNEDKKIIKNILILKIPISTCSGCMVYKSIANELLDEKLKNILKE